jgi:hypothetical protein
MDRQDDPPKEIDPLGRRRGSLRGSGTHDENSVRDPAGGQADRAEPSHAAPSVGEEAGAGATELEAQIRAREPRPS